MNEQNDHNWKGVTTTAFNIQFDTEKNHHKLWVTSTAYTSNGCIF